MRTGRTGREELHCRFSQKPDPEKPEDNSYEWGAGDSAFEKYKEEPEQSSGVKYTEEIRISLPRA